MIKQALLIVGCSLFVFGCDDVEGELTSDRSFDHPGPYEEPVGEGLPGNGEGVIRRVEVRNPLGTLKGNLLADGDFELSVSPWANGQYPWVALTNDIVPLKAETGGICRTGLRCVVLEANTIMLGTGTSAGEGIGMEASLWVKPEQDQGCDVMDAYALTGSDYEFIEQLEPVETPDPAGWCRYSALLPAQDDSVNFYLDTEKMEAGQTALLDSASLLPTTASSLKGYKKLAPSQALRDRVAWARDVIRRTKIYGRVERPRLDEGP